MFSDWKDYQKKSIHMRNTWKNTFCNPNHQMSACSLIITLDNMFTVYDVFWYVICSGNEIVKRDKGIRAMVTEQQREAGKTFCN